VINEEAGQRGIGFVDRLGRPAGQLARGVFDGAGRLSRDDTRITAGFTNPAGPGSADIYVIDIASGQRSQLTSDPRWDQTPAWAPDGKAVMFRAPIEKMHTLFVRSSEGTDVERRLLTATDGGDLIVNDWAPDGTVVLIEKRVPRGSKDLMLLPMPAADRFEPWLATPANEGDANISPDGRWVTYVSDQSGADEVYVRAFRNGGAGLRVTTNGGASPIWGKDGHEIFFLDRAGMMVARAVTIGARSVTLGAVTILFDAAPMASGDQSFDIDRRGRFLMNYVEPGPAASRAEILINWPQAIRK
jgi:eukaryotic-like serine/threonine-protein kinase